MVVDMDKTSRKNKTIFWIVTCVWAVLAVWNAYFSWEILDASWDDIYIRSVLLLWTVLAVFAYMKIFELKGFGVLLPIIIALLIVIYTGAFRVVEDLGYEGDFYAIVSIFSIAALVLSIIYLANVKKTTGKMWVAVLLLMLTILTVAVGNISG